MSTSLFNCLILSCIYVVCIGCKIGTTTPTDMVNAASRTNIKEPTIEVISARETFNDDLISSIAVSGTGTLFATQVTNGSLLRFDRTGKDWGIVAGYNNNKWALNSVFFTDERHGFAVGNYGTIAKSQDGGKNWNHLQRISDLNLYDISFSDSRTGHIIAGVGIVDKTTGALSYKYVVYATHDGGAIWKEIFKTDNEQIFDLVTFSDNTVVISISGRYLSRSIDGGKSWNEVQANFKDANSIAVDSKGNGWLVSWKGEFWKSPDQGVSWKKANNISDELATQKWEDIEFDAFGNGLAISEGGVIAYTTDSGDTWKTLVLKEPLRDVVFRDRKGLILSEKNIFEIIF